MITIIRRMLLDDGVGLKVVVWIVFISMTIPTFLGVLPGLFKRFEQGPALVTIDGQQLDNRNVQNAINKNMTQIAMLRQQLGKMADQYLPMFGLMNPVQRAVDEVVIQHLVGGQADKITTRFDGDLLEQKMYDPYVVQDVVPLSVFDQRGGIDMHALNYYLRTQGKTLEDYKQMVQNTLERRTLASLVRMGAHVSELDIRNLFVRDYQAKQYELVTFPLSEFKKNVSVTDDEVQAYFTQETKKSKRYNVPEKRGGFVWQFPARDYGITISDEAIERYYNKHKHDEFVDQPPMVQIRKIVIRATEKNSQEAQARAEQLQQELKASPKKFAELAREHSEDEATAQDGGLTPYFKKGERDPDIEKAAFRLQEDGELSPLVTTKDGFVLMQRVGRKKKTFKTLASAKSKIEKTLFDRKYEERFNADAKRFIASIKDNPEMFEKFTEEKNATKTVLPAMPRSETTVIRNLFQLKKGQAGSFIELGRGYIVQLIEIEKAHTPSFEQVKDTVKQDLVTQQATKKLEEHVQKAFSRMSSEPLRALANQMNGSHKKTDFILKEDSKELAELKKQDFPVDHMLELVKEGAAAKGFSGQLGYIVRVADVQPLDAQLYEQKQQELVKQALYDEKERLFKGFVASLQRNATISIDKSRLTE